MAEPIGGLDPPPGQPGDVSYDERLVAFVDILGFSRLTEQEPDLARTTIARLDALLAEIDGSVLEAAYWGEDLTARMFSDCVCLTAPVSPGGLALLVDALAWFQLSCSLEGVLLRGGVARGPHFQNSRMIFSQGLVCAYQLEHKQARTPRIILAGDVLALGPDLPLIRLEKGISYIDYLWLCRDQGLQPSDHPYPRHRAMVESQLAREADEKVRDKLLWTAAYHNAKVDELIVYKRKSGDDRPSVNSLTSLAQVAPTLAAKLAEHTPVGSYEEFTAALQDAWKVKLHAGRTE